jgi:hypothetical protein
LEKKLSFKFDGCTATWTAIASFRCTCSGRSETKVTLRHLDMPMDSIMISFSSSIRKMYLHSDAMLAVTDHDVMSTLQAPLPGEYVESPLILYPVRVATRGGNARGAAILRREKHFRTSAARPIDKPGVAHEARHHQFQEREEEEVQEKRVEPGEAEKSPTRAAEESELQGETGGNVDKKGEEIGGAPRTQGAIKWIP